MTTLTFVVDGFDLSGYVRKATITGGDSEQIQVFDGQVLEGLKNPLEITVKFKSVSDDLDEFLFDLVGKVTPFQLNTRTGNILFRGGNFPVSPFDSYYFVTTGKIKEVAT